MVMDGSAWKALLLSASVHNNRQIAQKTQPHICVSWNMCGSHVGNISPRELRREKEIKLLCEVASPKMVTPGR